MTTKTIGALADATGVAAKTIRFYEEKGLLPPARRSGAGYRLYGDADLRRLRLIRQARTLGFTLAEAKRLVRLAEHEPCASFQGELARDVAQKLIAVDRLLADLERTRTELTALSGRLSSEDCGDCQEPALQCCASLDCSGA